MKIHEMIGLNLTKGDIGLEIEAEGPAIKAPKPHWRITHDDSLFEGYEVILNKPLPKAKLPVAIGDLRRAYEAQGIVPDFSIRTSVHVHINVQELTFDQLINYIILYWIYEDLLLEYCGEDRISNFYCLRRRDADHVEEVIERTIAKGQLHHLNEDLRYSSVNFNSVYKFGSLEFRGMRGTIDKDVLLPWTNLLFRLRESACEFGSLSDMFEVIDKEGLVKFTRDIFDRDMFKVFLAPRWTKKIKQNFLELKHFQFMEKEQPKHLRERQDMRAEEIDQAQRHADDVLLERMNRVLRNEPVPVPPPAPPQPIAAGVPPWHNIDDAVEF